MSERDNTKKSLAEAAYYYGECNTELEQAQDHAKRAEELTRDMASILLTLHQRWSDVAQKGQRNIVRANEIVSHMNDSLKAMEPLHADLFTTLTSHLLDARQGAEAIRDASGDIQAAVTFWPLEQMKDLSSQIASDSELFEHYATLGGEAWQHCDFAVATCNALRDTL